MANYQAGQRWKYRTRERDADSTVVIGKVQKSFFRQPVIHISVLKVTKIEEGGITDISHMPFSLKAIDASLLSLIESNLPVSAEFQDGFNTWKGAKGGVFEIPVHQAVDAIMSINPFVTDDPFDDHVRRMRAQKSEKMIGELYQKLVAMERWYFLCNPEDPRSPVEWVFPDGINKTPALLAFTSEERAAAAAHKLGIYPPGAPVSVMPSPVKEALKWISGKEIGFNWVCFNLTFENFPLYCDHAAKLLTEIPNQD